MPWPVSKYITLSPTVPRFSASAASRASPSIARLDTEASVGGLGAADGLEQQIDRRAAVDQLERRRHMRQHAPWVGISSRAMQIVQQLQQALDDRHRVGSGVDSDHRVAAAIAQAVDDGGGDAGGSSVGMVGLQAHGQVPGRPMVLRKRVTTCTFCAARIRSWLRMILATAAAHLRRDGACKLARAPAWSRDPTAGNRGTRRRSGRRCGRTLWRRGRRGSGG